MPGGGARGAEPGPAEVFARTAKLRSQITGCRWGWIAIGAGSCEGSSGDGDVVRAGRPSRREVLGIAVGGRVVRHRHGIERHTSRTVADPRAGGGVFVLRGNPGVVTEQVVSIERHIGLCRTANERDQQASDEQRKVLRTLHQIPSSGNSQDQRQASQSDQRQGRRFGHRLDATTDDGGHERVDVETVDLPVFVHVGFALVGPVE